MLDTKPQLCNNGIIGKGDPMRAKLQIENQQDTLQCVCGNTASDSGFEPCLDSRTIVEPTIHGQWLQELVLCIGCNKIINQVTLEII